MVQAQFWSQYHFCRTSGKGTNGLSDHRISARVPWNCCLPPDVAMGFNELWPIDLPADGACIVLEPTLLLQNQWHGTNGLISHSQPWFHQKLLWVPWTVNDWPPIRLCLHSSGSNAIWHNQRHGTNDFFWSAILNQGSPRSSLAVPTLMIFLISHCQPGFCGLLGYLPKVAWGVSWAVA